MLFLSRCLGRLKLKRLEQIKLHRLCVQLRWRSGLTFLLLHIAVLGLRQITNIYELLINHHWRELLLFRLVAFMFDHTHERVLEALELFKDLFLILIDDVVYFVHASKIFLCLLSCKLYSSHPLLSSN